MFLALLVVTTAVFNAFGFSTAPLQTRRRRTPVAVEMCICINCRFVDRCTAYHHVETKHGQPHLSQAPDFTPRNPTVAIIINSTNTETEVELDVTACDDFVQEKGRWTKMMPPGTLLKAGFDPDYVPT